VIIEGTRGGRPAVRDVPGNGKYIVWEGIFHVSTQRLASPRPAGHR
jgi:hypothetical protein